MSQKHVTWSCPNNQAESDKKKEKKTKKTVPTFIHLFLYLLPTNRPKLKKKGERLFFTLPTVPAPGTFYSHITNGHENQRKALHVKTNRHFFF